MDKPRLLKYIENGQEIELLENLELLGLNEYDDKYKRLIEILVVLLNHSKRSFLPIQQSLFKTIYRVLPKVLSSKESIEDFVSIIRTNSDGNYRNVSTFVSRFILNFYDKIPEIPLGAADEIENLKAQLKQLNIRFLKELISNKAEHNTITTAFYNCVDELGEDRRIILHRDAISVFYQYVQDNPKGYLVNFIRPYYHGPTKDFADFYLHVPEPFCERIFCSPNLSFDRFLGQLSAKGIDDKLINDIQSFYSRANAKLGNTDRLVMLFSEDNHQSINKDNHLKLQSSDHMGVRRSCIPPKYSSDDDGQFMG